MTLEIQANHEASFVCGSYRDVQLWIPECTYCEYERLLLKLIAESYVAHDRCVLDVLKIWDDPHELFSKVRSKPGLGGMK
jgi:hypothetical protein